MSHGMHAGLWSVPVAGFAWEDRPQLVRPRPAIVNGELRWKGPWLVPRDYRTRDYPVLRRAGLLDAFDRLGQRPTRDAVLNFANRWGFLHDPRPAPRTVLVPVRDPVRDDPLADL